MGRPSARDKLLDCAERLFAEHGLEGVSLRAINAEAGLSPAALHYHFGTQQALVEALLDRQMPALMERRRRLLDALDDRPEPPTTRDVLSALIRPQVELLAEGGESGLRYMRLIHRLQADGDLDPQFVMERWPGGVDRLVPLLRKASPSLPLPRDPASPGARDRRHVAKPLARAGCRRWRSRSARGGAARLPHRCLRGTDHR